MTGTDSIDNGEIERQARAAGLERAWALFPEDVLAAARQVVAQRVAASALVPNPDPWPPMTVPSSLPGRKAP